MFHTSIESICNTIRDYRNGEIDPITPKDVSKWASQFDHNYRDTMLIELDHVLQSTYFSKNRIRNFLTNLIENKELTGNNPCQFWSNARLLNIQQRGSSQREMLEILQDCLVKQCGKQGIIDSCNSNVFIYIDDAIFTGNHVHRDVAEWARRDAPQTATIHIIVAADHCGSYYAKNKLAKEIEETTKNITVNWWSCNKIENRIKYINKSDILCPRNLPNDLMVQAYAEGLKYPVNFRTGENQGYLQIFSSESNRHALEQGLLIAGVSIKNRCLNLKKSHRPLGYTSLECLGFGSTVVTYRNCPNNTPLAFWVGDPWFPLFPRKINEPNIDWGDVNF